MNTARDFHAGLAFQRPELIDPPVDPMGRLDDVHPDHRAEFLPTAVVELVWHGHREDVARAVLVDPELPTPQVMTKASDGTFAVWHLCRAR